MQRPHVMRLRSLRAAASFQKRSAAITGEVNWYFGFRAPYAHEMDTIACRSLVHADAAVRFPRRMMRPCPGCRCDREVLQMSLLIALRLILALTLAPPAVVAGWFRAVGAVRLQRSVLPRDPPGRRSLPRRCAAVR